MSQTIGLVEAAEVLGLTREAVRQLVRKGEIKGHKKTLTRTSAFVVDRDSVLDYDRRRREASQPQPPAH